MPSQDSMLELRRLLSRLVSKLSEEALQDRRWQLSQIDVLVEKMMPLWADCGFDEPGLYIGRDTDPEYRNKQGLSFISIEYCDPDGLSRSTIFLDVEPYAGGPKVVATVGELIDVAQTAQGWIAWIGVELGHFEPLHAIEQTCAATIATPQSVTIVVQTNEGIPEDVTPKGKSTLSKPSDVVPPGESPDRPLVNKSSQDSNIASQVRLETIPKAWRDAYIEFNHAEEKTERRLKREDAWKWLKQNGTSIDGYKLPKLKSFCNYVSRARTMAGDRRNQRRGNDCIETRSVVRAYNLEKRKE
jgi:hypothetical protein